MALPGLMYDCRIFNGGDMALSKCSECGGAVSGVAAACPHCGAPSPALTRQQLADTVASAKRAFYGKLGALAFLIGAGWMLGLIVTGSDKESVVAAWGAAKYLIGGGAAAYVVAEIQRNLDERRAKSRT
jgi:hypothetical protein